MGPDGRGFSSYAWHYLTYVGACDHVSAKVILQRARTVPSDRHSQRLVREHLQESAPTRILDRLSKPAAGKSFYG
jgi:hypothetical protein